MRWINTKRLISEIRRKESVEIPIETATGTPIKRHTAKTIRRMNRLIVE
jgi:hypothetical protein